MGTARHPGWDGATAKSAHQTPPACAVVKTSKEIKTTQPSAILPLLHGLNHVMRNHKEETKYWIASHPSSSGHPVHRGTQEFRGKTACNCVIKGWIITHMRKRVGKLMSWHFLTFARLILQSWWHSSSIGHEYVSSMLMNTQGSNSTLCSPDQVLHPAEPHPYRCGCQSVPLHHSKNGHDLA